MATTIASTIEYLSTTHQVHASEKRGLYLHYDQATLAWWMFTRDDLKLLGRMLAEDDAFDAYSRWCSQTSGIEINLDKIAGEYDADADLDALMSEAGAADDMPSYMALCFLRDEVEELIRQNAEIAAGQALDDPTA